MVLSLYLFIFSYETEDRVTKINEKGFIAGREKIAYSAHRGKNRSSPGRDTISFGLFLHGRILSQWLPYRYLHTASLSCR